MKRISLTMAGFLAYKDETTIDFTEGEIVAIVGPNGSGKTSIPDAITWARYGTPRTKGDSDAIINDYCDEARVEEVLADDNGDLWMIQRKRRRGKSAQTLMLYAWDDDLEDWRQFSRYIGENQEQINTLLGLTKEAHDTLTVYSSRGSRGIALVNSSTDKRTAILTSLRPALSIWPELNKDIVDLHREARRDEADQVAEIESQGKRMSDILDRIEKLDDQAAALGTEKALRADLESARSQLRQISDADAQERIDNLRVQLRAVEAEARVAEAEQSEKLVALQGELGEVESAAKHVEELSAEISDIEGEIKRARADLSRKKSAVSKIDADIEKFDDTIEKARDELARMESSLEHSRESLIDLEERHRAAEDSDGECTVCGSPLSDERAQKVLDSINDQLDESEKAIQQHERGVEETRNRLTTANKERRKAVSRLESNRSSIDGVYRDLDGLDRELRSAQKQISEQEAIIESCDVEKLRKRRDRAKAVLSDTQEAGRQKVEDVKQALEEARQGAPRAKDVQAVERRIERLERDLRKIAENDGQIKELRASFSEEEKVCKALERELPKIRQRASDLAFLRQATGRQGIPYLMLAEMLGNIEERANEYLAIINGDSSMELQLNQQFTDRGDANLDIMVASSDGFTRSVESMSNGEVTRVSLALMFGLASVVNGSRPGLVSDVFLDEPLGSVDAKGTTGAIAAMRHAIDSGVVENIILVAHDVSVQDACDRQVTISAIKAGEERIDDDD